MSDQKRPYRMTRRAELEEQTRRRITESAVALHEELGPARTSISADRRARGRAPLDRLPPLPRRGGALRRLLVALARGEPAARSSRLGGDRGPGRAHRSRAARALRVLRDAPSRCTTACSATSRSSRSSSACCATSTATCGAIQDVLMAGRGLRGRAARRTRRGDRPRARVSDLALAHPRAAIDRRRCRRAHVPAHRERRSRAPRTLIALPAPGDRRAPLRISAAR